MKVRLSLHAQNLRSIHKFRPSCPYAKVSSYTGDVRDAFVLGKTEVIQLTSTPMWVQPIIIDYDYAAPMQVKVSIFDRSSSTSREDKPMGTATVFDIDAALKNNAQRRRSIGGNAVKNLSGGDGWIFLQADILPEGEESKDFMLTIEGREISAASNSRTSGIGKPDTFFEICRKNVEASSKSLARPVYRSEVAKSSSKPKWEKARINLDWLCGGNINADVQISVYEHRKTGQHNQIAMSVVSVDSLIRFNRLGLTWHGKDAGKIKVVEARIVNGRFSNPANDVLASRSSLLFRSKASAKSTSSLYSQLKCRTSTTTKTMNNTATRSSIGHGSIKNKRSSEPTPVVPGTFTAVSLEDDNEEDSPSSAKQKRETATRGRRTSDNAVNKTVASSPDDERSTSRAASSVRSTTSRKARAKQRSVSFDQAKDMERSLCRIPSTSDKMKTTKKKRLSFDTSLHYSPNPSHDNEEAFDLDVEEAILAVVKAIQRPDQAERSHSGHIEGNKRATSIGSNASWKSAATAPVKTMAAKATRRRTVGVGSPSSTHPSAVSPANASDSKERGRRKSFAGAPILTNNTSLTSRQSDSARTSFKPTPVAVELLIHARNLKNLSKLSGISDPYAVISLIEPMTGDALKALGTTEVIDNCLSPVWCEPVVLDYTPGTICSIEIKIFDQSNNHDDKEMGVARFDVGSVLSSSTSMKAKRLEKGGWVFVHAENISQEMPQKDITVTLEGSDLKNVEGMMKGVSDPFYVLSRRDGSGVWRAIYRSEHISNDLNPKWKQCRVNYRRLCGSDDSVLFRISVYDHEKSGKHRDMGSLETTVEGLISAYGFDSNAKPLQLEKDGKGFGCIVVKRAYISTVPLKNKRTSSISHGGRRRHFQPDKQVDGQSTSNEKPNPLDFQGKVKGGQSVVDVGQVAGPDGGRANDHLRLTVRNDTVDPTRRNDASHSKRPDVQTSTDIFVPASRRQPKNVQAFQQEAEAKAAVEKQEEGRVDARSGFMAIFRALQLSEEKISADSTRVLQSKEAIDTIIGSTIKGIGGTGPV